jgi:hypothetical protein
MNAYCPECETELDVATGICPACRWDPMMVRPTITPADVEPEMSLTERYRGTRYDISLEQLAMNQRSGVSRGRAFVIMTLVAAVALYGAVIGAMGVL